MKVRRAGADGFAVRVDRAEQSVLYISRNMVGSLKPVPTLVVPHVPAPWTRGALAVATGVMPDGVATRRVPMMPDPGTGIHQPWWELQGTGILVSSATAAEFSFRRGLAAEPLLYPHHLPVPAVGGVLRGAAEDVLACTQPETLLRVAMHWAFACDVLHRPWAENRDALRYHSLSGPEANLPEMQVASHRLIMPQLVRVIAMDAIYSRGRTGGTADGPGQFSAAARTLVSEFFPSFDRSEPPSHPEIRTALWILSQDTPFDDLGDGGTSTLMAYTFGLQSIGEPQDSLERWVELVSLDDHHPQGSWTEGKAPSDLRSDVRTASGLDLRDVAKIVRWMLTVMMQLQYQSNQLFTLASLAPLANSSIECATEDALSFVSAHLVTSIVQLREANCFGDDHLGDGDLGEGVVDRRRAIEERLQGRPFLQFDDGSIIPVSIPDTVYRTISLCQEAHSNQNESIQQRSQRIGNILGRCFEAYVKGLCHSLGAGHQVIGSAKIDAVIDKKAGDSSKRADIVIGDSKGNYAVLEITKRNLLGGIRYGDAAALSRWADGYLTKLQQTTSTVAHLHAITRASGAPAPQRISRLVVADLPLRQDLGLSTLFDTRSDDRNPPFLCGIAEFEFLIERGRQGYSVPAIISVWQNRSDDASLGLFLSNYPSP